MFQFAPVYVSAESMRWWLGRECFARHKCILATREEWMMEDEEDEEEDSVVRKYYEGHRTDSEKPISEAAGEDTKAGRIDKVPNHAREKERGQFAWYNEQFPPLALWVCGNDDLVDGRRLLRRFDRGREPHVTVVHKKIIEGYEHLDVIWAMDMIDKVGREVKEVIWKTASEQARAVCRIPSGCEELHNPAEDEEKQPAHTDAGDQTPTTENHTRPREIDTEKANGAASAPGSAMHSPVSKTQIETTTGEWSDHLRKDSAEFRDSHHKKHWDEPTKETTGSALAPRRRKEDGYPFVPT